MGRAIGHLNESAGFLAGGVRGWLAGGLRASESARAPSVREPTCFLCISETFWCGSSSSSRMTPELHQKDGTGCAQGGCPRTCLNVCFVLLLWLIVY